MPCPFLIVSQSNYLIQVADTNSHTLWQTVQIQISWLLQKPTDLDLHCLQRYDIFGFSRTRVNLYWFIWSLKCQKNLQQTPFLFLFTFQWKHELIFHLNSLTWNVKSYSLWKIYKFVLKKIKMSSAAVVTDAWRLKHAWKKWEKVPMTKVTIYGKNQDYQNLITYIMQ